MATFRLGATEIMEILDQVHPDAYDKFQSALESKVLDVLSEKKWLDIWESGEWQIGASISFDLPKELLDNQ